MTAYYNEIDRFACDWLSNLMDAGLITPGKIDDRSIHDVGPDDLDGFERVHFFAGIGGWDYALNRAGWRGPVWTGSCPCQPFSAIGQRKGFDDERHLWPQFKRLISERHPAIVFGEQSSQAVDWLRHVRGDLEAMDYAVGAIPMEAASAGADVLGDRFWFVAASDLVELRRQSPAGQQPKPQQDPRPRSRDARRNESWRCGADGKKRRVNTGIDWLAHGVSRRMAKLRGYGNAIDWRPASQFIIAASEAMTNALSLQHSPGGAHE